MSETSPISNNIFEKIGALFRKRIVSPEKPHNLNPSFPEWSTYRKTIVTCRDYESVLSGLAVPSDYFIEGEKVLSVGEGFSNFSRKLHEEKHTDSFAIDPIYEMHGKVIVNEDGVEETIDIFQKDPEKIAKIIENYYGESVKFNNIKNIGTFESFDDEKEIPLLDPERSIAASVYKLPFSDKSFDKVVSFRVLEHINFEKALPELLRVIKDDGEIRMAGLKLSVFPLEKKLSSKVTERSIDGMYSEWVPHKGLMNSLDLIINNQSIQAYVITENYQKNNNAFSDMTKGTVLIIRKDNKWPKIPEAEDQYSSNKKTIIVKISKEKPNKNTEGKSSCYKLLNSPDVK